MKNLSIILLCLLCATVTAQDVLKSEFFDVDVIMKYQSEIELSNKQKESIKKVHKNHSADFNNAKWDLEGQMSTLNTMLGHSKVDKAGALKQMKSITELEESLKLIRLEMLIEMKNVLSETQQIKLKSLRTDGDMKPISVFASINENQKIKLQIAKNVNPEIQPLYILLDKYGKREVKQSLMTSLDPNNIESVNVIKGNSAVLKYGERGENGVVVIKLKQQ